MRWIIVATVSVAPVIALIIFNASVRVSGEPTSRLLPTPTNEERHRNAGVEHAEQGRFEEALTEYNQAIRIDPQRALTYRNRGDAYYDLGQYQRAIEDYTDVIRLDPLDVVAYNNRGLAYAHLGEHKRAIEDLDEAIRLDPLYAGGLLQSRLGLQRVRRAQTGH